MMNSPQRAPSIERLFRHSVFAFEMHGTGSVNDLLPAELECVGRAVDKRVREFAAGRACARAGLVALGLEPVALIPDQNRAPQWPAGIVGSITHTHGYCLAVVGLKKELDAIGVDAECVSRMKPELWRMVMRAEEIASVQGLDEIARQPTAALVFSAKEAFYKCQYVLTRSWLGFEDVAVSIGDGDFQVSVLRTTSPLQQKLSHAGRFTRQGELVISVVSMPS